MFELHQIYLEEYKNIKIRPINDLLRDINFTY